MARWMWHNAFTPSALVMPADGKWAGVEFGDRSIIIPGEVSDPDNDDAHHIRNI